MKPGELASYVGKEVALSEWILVDQARVQAFADATGDHQFIHVDAEKAAAGPFGTTIVHGFLTLSLLAGDFMTHGGAPHIEGVKMTVNYGLNRVRFISPVKVGSRLRNRAVLQSADQGADHMQITVLNTIEIEGEERPAATAESVFRVYL